MPKIQIIASLLNEGKTRGTQSGKHDRTSVQVCSILPVPGRGDRGCLLMVGHFSPSPVLLLTAKASLDFNSVGKVSSWILASSSTSLSAGSCQKQRPKVWPWLHTWGDVSVRGGTRLTRVQQPGLSVQPCQPRLSSMPLKRNRPPYWVRNGTNFKRLLGEMASFPHWPEGLWVVYNDLLLVCEKGSQETTMHLSSFNSCAKINPPQLWLIARKCFILNWAALCRAGAKAGFAIQQQPVRHLAHSKAALLTSVQRKILLIVSFTVYTFSQR